MSLKVDKVQLDIIINNDQSRTQLRALDEEIKKASKSLSNMKKAGMEGTAEYNNQLVSLQTLQTQYESIQKEIGITGMTTKELRKHMSELKLVMDNLDPNSSEFSTLKQELTETKTRYDELTKGAAKTGDALNYGSVGVTAYEVKAESLRAQLREVRNELGRLIAAGEGVDNPEVVTLAKKYDELSDAMAQAKNTAELMDKAGMLQGFVKTVGAVAAGFEVARGAAALFGDENENLQKVMVKVQASIAMVHGLEVIGNALRKEGTVITFLNVAAQKLKVFWSNLTTKAVTAETAATEAGTVANKAFSSSMKSNIWIALATTIAAIGISIWKYVKGLNATTEAQRELNAESAKTSLSIQTEESKFTSLWQKIKDSQPDSDQRIQAVKDLNDEYPDLLTNIDLEKASLTELNSVYGDTVSQIKMQIELKAKQAEAEALYAKIAEQTQTLAKGGLSSGEIQEAWTTLEETKSKYTALLDEISKISDKKTYGTEAASLMEERKKLVETYDLFMKGTRQVFDDSGNLVDIDIDQTLSSITEIDTKIAALTKTKATYTKAGSDASKENKDATEAEYTEIEKLIDSLTLQNAKINDSANFLYQVNDACIKYFTTLGELNKSLKDGSITQDEYNAKLAIAKQEYDNLEKAAYDSSTEIIDAVISITDEVVNGSTEIMLAADDVRTAFQQMWDGLDDQGKLDYISKRLSTFNDTIGQVGDIFEQSFRNAEIASNNYFGAEYEKLEKQKNKKIISEEEYNQKLTALNEQREAAEKKIRIEKAKSEKTQAIISAVMSTAQGIMKVLADYGLPWGLIPAAVMAALGAVQIATISKQPLPQYEKGNYPIAKFEKDINNAKKIKSIDRFDAVDDAIINKINNINNEDEIKTQYSIGKYKVIGADDGKTYDAQYKKNAKTGLISSPTILAGEKPEIIIDPATTRNLQMNYPGIIEAIYAARVPQFASGSYPVNTNQQASTIITQSDPEMKDLLRQILEENKKPTRAKLYYSDIKKMKETDDKSKEMFNN